MPKKISLIITALVLLTSCNFNKLFLIPAKIPTDTKKISLYNNKGNENVSVYFSGDNYQPTFIRNGKDTIDLGFTIESVVFKSSNGNKINGWFLKPKHPTPLVTIIHFHGNAGNLLSQFELMSPFVKKGFQVFLFDYSGFGFSEGKATKNNVMTDALSVLDYIKSRPEIKNTKLIIYGQSLGGHLSIVVADKRQNDIDGLVIEGAFSSHKDIAANIAGIFGRIIVKQNYCALKSIKNYKKPILVIHSTEDEVIPFKLGQKLFNNANEPKEFYEIRYSHIQGPLFYSDEISGKIKNMLQIK